MNSAQLTSYVLEPPGVFTPDPACPHCASSPGYTHRHWTRRDPAAPERRDGPVWQALFWVFGDWGIGRRAARRGTRPGA